MGIIRAFLRLFGLSKKKSGKKNAQAAQPQASVPKESAAQSAAAPNKNPLGKGFTSAKPVARPETGTVAPVSKPQGEPAVLCENCGNSLSGTDWFCGVCGTRTSRAEPVFSSATAAQKQVAAFKGAMQTAEKKAKAYAALGIQKDGDLLFKTNDNTVIITGFAKTNTGAQIPPQIQGMPVVEIVEKAFYKKGLTSVTIPATITTIGESAFGHNNLTAITIPGSVVTVGKFAFSGNDLENITIEEGVQSIGQSAFEKTTKFNEMVSKIANVTIPGSMKEIGEEAFFRSRIGGITIKSGVQKIRDNAFMGNQLKSVTIPEGVTSIGKYAFHENFLESLSLPDSLTEIGAEAFSNGSKLTDLKLPPNLKKLGENAFEGNKFTEIVIPASLKKIGEEAFGNNGLTSVTIPEGVVTIGKRAFEGNKLTSIVFPTSVKTLEEKAFAGNKLSGDITIPETIETIGKGAFQNNQLTGVIVMGNTAISKEAFESNQISKVIIGSRVPSIGEDAFSSQVNDKKERTLVGVTVPESVKIAPGGFDNYVYAARGETDNLSLDDASYWQAFAEKIKAEKIAKMPVRTDKAATVDNQPLIVTLHDANGKQIGTASFSDAAYSGSYRSLRAVGYIVDPENKIIAQVTLRAPPDFVSEAQNFGIVSKYTKSSRDAMGCFVTVDGEVLFPYTDEIISDLTGRIKSAAAKKAELSRIGNVKIEGNVGVAYNKDGVKVGEARNGGEFAAVYAGAIIRFFTDIK